MAATALRTASGSGAFDGWTVSGNPTVDPTVGLPMPSWKLPGNGSYIWRDNHKAYAGFAYKVMSQGLVDFFFGCNDKGAGQMFRIDTRASGNYAGFASTTSWTSWGSPSSGFYAPANTWIQVDLTLGAATATVRCTWVGGYATVQLAPYRASGTAFDFQGDGLGASSYSWISDFHTLT